MDVNRSVHKSILLYILLACITLITYWPAVRCNFVILDDPFYVVSNPRVPGGLSLENIVWAFRTGFAGNWHPGGPDWCSAQVHLDRTRGKLWTTCQDYGLLMLKFTNGAWPLPQSATPPGEQN